MIILNYANPDMVGHTGVMEAAKAAVEAVDTCLGRVVDKVLELDGTVFITADHGNAETMIDLINMEIHLQLTQLIQFHLYGYLTTQKVSL